MPERLPRRIHDVDIPPDQTADHPIGFMVRGFPCMVVALLCAWLMSPMACAIGLLTATALTFVLFLPLTALVLNGGQPVRPEEPGPTLSTMASGVLFLCWAASVGLVALMV